MDFFTAQDHARRNTGRLVFFFLLAVVSLIVLTNLLVLVILGFAHHTGSSTHLAFPFDWQIFFGVGAVVLLVVAGGTFYKISALSGGGDAVAAMFGAVPVFADDPDIDNRKLVHVVEEMAIAAGTPVPQVYVLNENGINAFAAGFSTSDAIVAATRGAVKKLNREQLQGVIAHEFSHILNGDMRLNIRLVGILHGILLIGLIGGQILRGSGRTGRSSRGSGGVILLGLGLLVIGYAGTFFGKLIKSAVSRQREFLADASAVQFTRNPDGIGGALMRIGAAKTGSQIQHPKSEELSHAFFGQAVAVTFESLFATHPPLAERIRRILPGWDGNFPKETDHPEKEKAPRKSAAAEPAPEAALGLTGAAVVNQIGRPDERHLNRARLLLRGIPEVFQKAARDPFATRAVLLYLVLDQDGEIRAKQLEHLKTSADRGVYPETLRLLRAEGNLLPEQRLPLIELALPTLHRISKEQARLFLNNINTLIKADGKITLFEWCLNHVVVEYLKKCFEKPSEEGPLIQDLSQAKHDCTVVLSTLIHAAHNQKIKPHEVFAEAACELGQTGMEIIPAEKLNLAELDQALKVLKRLKPQAKALLIKACTACVLADGRIEQAEAELLRGVAATLSIPMPPLS